VENEGEMRPSIADIVEKLNVMQEWGMNTGTVNTFHKLQKLILSSDKWFAVMLRSCYSEFAVYLKQGRLILNA
jgi:hypothetical protein